MYLFFDTETNGIPRNWKAPTSDLSNWPRLVQLAWVLYDNNGKEISRNDHIVKPEGFTIPYDATKIHGITTERAYLEGKQLNKVLEEFNSQILKTVTVVAHNISFDEKIVGAEFLRSGFPNSLQNKIRICTMQRTTNFCAIPGNYGYKWPKLNELHIKLFGCDFEDAHNAVADINATAKCFWELKKLNLI